MFPCVSWQSVYLLWKNAYLDFLPIFDCIVCFLILSYMSCLCIYILKINPMLVSSIANVFHSVYCLFVLFMISFAVQKFLSLIRSYLFIFVFIFIILGGGSQRILLCDFLSLGGPYMQDFSKNRLRKVCPALPIYFLHLHFGVMVSEWPINQGQQS